MSIDFEKMNISSEDQEKERLRQIHEGKMYEEGARVNKGGSLEATPQQIEDARAEMAEDLKNKQKIEGPLTEEVIDELAGQSVSEFIAWVDARSDFLTGSHLSEKITEICNDFLERTGKNTVDLQKAAQFDFDYDEKIEYNEFEEGSKQGKILFKGGGLLSYSSRDDGSGFRIEQTFPAPPCAGAFQVF